MGFVKMASLHATIAISVGQSWSGWTEGYLLSAVMVSWSTVANDTQRRYGILA